MKQLVVSSEKDCLTAIISALTTGQLYHPTRQGTSPEEQIKLKGRTTLEKTGTPDMGILVTIAKDDTGYVLTAMGLMRDDELKRIQSCILTYGALNYGTGITCKITEV